MFHIDHSVWGALHLYDLETTDRSRGRIGAVGGVGDDNAGALAVASALVVRTYYHKSREFSVSSCARAQREVTHTREGAKHLTHAAVKLQGSLAGFFRLQRVQSYEGRMCRHLFVDNGVVLHSTAAQRIEAVIHSEVVLAVVSIVTHHRQFVALGKFRRFAAQQCRGQLFRRVSVVIRRQRIAATPFLRQLEYQISV